MKKKSLTTFLLRHKAVTDQRTGTLSLTLHIVVAAVNEFDKRWFCSVANQQRVVVFGNHACSNLRNTVWCPLTLEQNQVYIDGKIIFLNIFIEHIVALVSRLFIEMWKNINNSKQCCSRWFRDLLVHVNRGTIHRTCRSGNIFFLIVYLFF